MVLTESKVKNLKPEARSFKISDERGLYLEVTPADGNPIKKAFSKLKAMLRKAEERTVSGLWDLIGKLVERMRKLLHLMRI